MRIAFLTGEYPPQPGGIGDYTQQLGMALAVRGHSVLVLTIADYRLRIVDLSSPNAKPQSPPHTLQSGWGWRSQNAVLAALAATQPDILHIQYQTGAYAMRPAINLLPWRLRRQPSRPSIVVTAHDLLQPYLFPKAGPARAWVTRRLLADADALVLTNPDDAAQAQALLGAPAPPAIIPIGSNIGLAPPPGYSRAAWRARLGLHADQTLVAYFGLISRTKGLATLLDALATLPANLRLLVIGGAASAPEDREYAVMIRQQINTLGLGSRVSITGHSPADEVSAHLLAADMAALPFSDGASFRRGSLLAALAHGVPTITTTPAQPRSPMPQLPALADGVNVLLVPPNDPAALARAISALAHDAGLRTRLAAGGQALARQFSWETIAKQHETLYARLGPR